MKGWKVRRDGLYFNSSDTWSAPNWRVQAYWPEVKVGRGELHVMLRTTVRIVAVKGRFGLGFQVLGFGAGIAYDA
jgi:hypothetical protein